MEQDTQHPSLPSVCKHCYTCSRMHLYTTHTAHTTHIIHIQHIIHTQHIQHTQHIAHTYHIHQHTAHNTHTIKYCSWPHSVASVDVITDLLVFGGDGLAGDGRALVNGTGILAKEDRPSSASPVYHSRLQRVDDQGSWSLPDPQITQLDPLSPRP